MSSLNNKTNLTKFLKWHDTCWDILSLSLRLFCNCNLQGGEKVCQVKPSRKHLKTENGMFHSLRWVPFDRITICGQVRPEKHCRDQKDFTGIWDAVLNLIIQSTELDWKDQRGLSHRCPCFSFGWGDHNVLSPSTISFFSLSPNVQSVLKSKVVVKHLDLFFLEVDAGWCS